MATLTAATFYFFGIVCSASAPTDCTRIVFDQPMDGNYLLYSKPVQPLTFTSYAECERAIPAKFYLQKPLTVEGSIWIESGCTKNSP